MNNDDDPNSLTTPDLPTLSAFVDDELPDAERAGVLERLANDPHAAAQVAAWLAQKSTLKALFSAPEHEESSFIVLHAPDPWWRVCVAVGLLVAGTGVTLALGALAPRWIDDGSVNDPMTFAKRADVIRSRSRPPKKNI